MMLSFHDEVLQEAQLKGYRISWHPDISAVTVLQKAAVRVGASGLISEGGGWHLPSAQKMPDF